MEKNNSCGYIWTSVLYFPTQSTYLFRHFSQRTIRVNKPWRSWTSTVTVSSGGNRQCHEIFPRFNKHVTVPGDQFEAVRWVGKTFPAVQHGSGGAHSTMITPVGRTSHLHHTQLLHANVLGVSSFVLTKSDNTTQLFLCPTLVQ